MKNGFSLLDFLAAVFVAAVGITALARLSAATTSSVAHLKPALVQGTPSPIQCRRTNAASSFTCVLDQREVTVLGEATEGGNSP